MSLTENQMKALKPKDKSYKKADERGLYVEVSPTGGKLWRYRYRVGKIEKKLSIGTYGRHHQFDRDDTSRPIERFTQSFLTAAGTGALESMAFMYQPRISTMSTSATVSGSLHAMLSCSARKRMKSESWAIPI
jgi:hypothetical protein